jgi:uncharacterized protein (DUF1800 family)
MGGPRRRITRPNDFKDQGATARLLRQMYLGPKWSEITNITNPNNVTGLQATLVQGNKTITLTSGSTANLFVGQTLQANGIGINAGAFGNTNPTIIDIELGSTTNCTIDFAHTSGGSINFDALSVVNTGLDRFIEKQMDIPIPVRTAEQPAFDHHRMDFNASGPSNTNYGYFGYDNPNLQFGEFGALPFFIVSNDGTETLPSKMLLTVKGANLTTFNPAFTIISGTVTGGLIPTANANSVFITASSMATNSVTIMCTQDGLSSNITIIKASPSSVSNVLSFTTHRDDYYVLSNTTSNNITSLYSKLICFMNNSDKSLLTRSTTFRGMNYSLVSSNVTAIIGTGNGNYGGRDSYSLGRDQIRFSNMIANTATITITANCGTTSSPTSVGSLSKTITLKKSFAGDSQPISNAKNLYINVCWYENKTMEETSFNLYYNAGSVGRRASTGGVLRSLSYRYYYHPDKFRTRIARAFAEYFSMGYVDTIEYNRAINPFDIYCKNAFGDFKTLLMEVTRCWQMQYWLTYNNNSKANGDALPDENYARELMQLFTIGLWELKLDGTRKKAFELDTNDSRYIPQGTNGWDQEVPTYIYSADVANLARVFTGLRTSYGPTFLNEEKFGSFGEVDGGDNSGILLLSPQDALSVPGPSTFNRFRNKEPCYDGFRNRAIINSTKHEYELPKVTMAWKYTGDANTVTGNTVEQDLAFSYQQANNGMIVIPRRSTTDAGILTNTEKYNNTIAGSTSERDLPTSVGMREVDIVLTALVNHPSCAPYFAGRMIRMIVTSNPSPDYIARVASVFKNDGTGQVGNLRAVFKAIIMDQEARAPASKGLISRATDMFDIVSTVVSTPPWSDYYENPNYYTDQVNYGPLQSTSVFGTYPTLYAPSGPVGSNNIISPETYFYTENSILDLYNHSYTSTNFSTNMSLKNFSYSSEQLSITSNTSIQTSAQANTNIQSLISKYNILFTGNTMPSAYSSNIFSIIQSSTRSSDDQQKSAYRIMLNMILTSPFSVIRT